MTTIQHLRDLMARATPEPWRYAHDEVDPVVWHEHEGVFFVLSELDVCVTHRSPAEANANAEFAATARAILPALLDEVEAGRALIDLDGENGFSCSVYDAYHRARAATDAHLTARDAGKWE